MDIYKIPTIDALITGNPYVGRGIVLGKTPDGKSAVAAYFIMGRSENSRNRIFTETEGEVFTEPFDRAKVQDPSLIIYAAVRQLGNHLIVTNGNQTDTIYDGLAHGLSFSEALTSRCFEPDAPNFTPRISGMLTFRDGDCTYEMSILKSRRDRLRLCALHVQLPVQGGPRAFSPHLCHRRQSDPDIPGRAGARGDRR